MNNNTPNLLHIHNKDKNLFGHSTLSMRTILKKTSIEL